MKRTKLIMLCCLLWAIVVTQRTGQLSEKYKEALDELG
nr:MAG TPA: hypothetical protein [Caudoviricetes sp.]